MADQRGRQHLVVLLERRAHEVPRLRAVDEAVEMLMKEAAMSKEGAVAEVRRYTQTPSYNLSYLLGKHLILKLRENVMEKLGTKYNERFFHDTITANGYLPISMLRKVFDQKIS